MQDRWNAFVPYPPSIVPSRADGPLAGLRIAVKDLFDVAGYPTAAGNPVLLAASGIKSETAPVIQTLLHAGAEFAGKTNTDELAYSLIGRNLHFGMPINPRRPDRIPGGSSSGSAVAVAAGLAEIGVGTDTSGSIRLPAAANGLFGWRPTHGILNPAGVRPLAPSFDTPGLITADLAHLERAMVSLGIKTKNAQEASFIVADDILAHCSSDITEGFLAMLDRRAIRFERVSSVSSFSLSNLGRAFTTILQREAWLSNADLFLRYGASIEPSIAERLAKGAHLSDDEVIAAKQIRIAFKNEASARLRNKILIMPTLPVVVPKRDASAEDLQHFRTRSIELLCLSGLSGFPQLTAPLTAGTELASISLLATEGNDFQLCSVMKTIAT